MMRNVQIDFHHIHTWNKLYRVLKKNLGLPEYFATTWMHFGTALPLI